MWLGRVANKIGKLALGEQVIEHVFGRIGGFRPGVFGEQSVPISSCFKSMLSTSKNSADDLLSVSGPHARENLFHQAR